MRAAAGDPAVEAPPPSTAPAAHRATSSSGPTLGTPGCTLYTCNAVTTSSLALASSIWWGADRRARAACHPSQEAASGRHCTGAREGSADHQRSRSSIIAHSQCTTQRSQCAARKHSAAHLLPLHQPHDVPRLAAVLSCRPAAEQESSLHLLRWAVEGAAESLGQSWLQTAASPAADRVGPGGSPCPLTHTHLAVLGEELEQDALGGVVGHVEAAAQPLVGDHLGSGREASKQARLWAVAAAAGGAAAAAALSRGPTAGSRHA